MKKLLYASIFILLLNYGCGFTPKYKGFTGIDDPYEAPDKADLIVDTENESLDDSANKVKEFLKSRNLL